MRILYVEDEVFIAQIVKESLEAKGFDVCHVADGGEAFASYLNFEPQICILDVMLPNEDGFSIAKKIRQKNQDVPIIFLTAKNQTQDVVHGFELGGNDYLKKPFSMEELLVRVNNLLKMSKKEILKPTESIRISIGKYQFSPLRYELIFNEQAQKLSHREVQLINLFCEKPNQVIERKEVLLNIWNDDSIFNSRNLDVYINKIRAYFEQDTNVQLITLKGVGFKFVF